MSILLGKSFINVIVSEIKLVTFRFSFTYYNGGAMKITQSENAVIDHIREKLVASQKALQEALNVSHMTVVRALTKFGYHSSYNKNSAYYTLAGIPTFDANGLWSHKDIHFSRYGTLQSTLLSLVKKSPSGFTVQELERLLEAKTGNLLCRLCREKRISRFYFGRNAVYVSVNRASIQETARRIQRQKPEAPAHVTISDHDSQFPAGVDALRVVAVLVEFIKTPTKTAASVSQTLQARGIAIPATQVRTVIQFYSLEKKTAR